MKTGLSLGEGIHEIKDYLMVGVYFMINHEHVMWRRAGEILTRIGMSMKGTVDRIARLGVRSCYCNTRETVSSFDLRQKTFLHSTKELVSIGR